jgi:hypothetical protein
VRRLTLVLPVLLAAIVVPASLSFADGPSDKNGPTPTPETPPPTIVAEVTVPPSEKPGTTGTTGSVVASVPCSWTRIGATMEDAEDLNGVFEVLEILIESVGVDFVITVTFYAEDGTLHRYNSTNGQYEYSVEADCSNATDPGGWETGDVDWLVATPPDPAILLPGVRRRVTEPIRPPTADVSPVEGVVNLGMWLAVEAQQTYSVTAELGDVWARTTAELSETTFVIPDGDGTATVTCDGIGTPIPDSAKESVEEGPCGYTVGAPVDGGELVVTSAWTVTWELSDGRSGTYSPILVSDSIPYDVIEIQTVGRRN